MKIKLSDVCEKDSSNLAQKDLTLLNGIYPVYGASGLIKYIDSFHQNKDYVAIVKDGAGVGRTMFLPAKSSVIGTLQYLLPKENINPKYLYYAVRTMNIGKKYSGSTIPHIYFKDYGNEKFDLPNDTTQALRVKRLESIEAIINNKAEQIILLDNLIKSRFVEMFGDPNLNQMNWKQKPLSEYLDIVGGYAFKSEEFMDEGIPILRIGNVNTGFFKPVNIVYWSYDEMLERYRIYPGDLVISLTGTVGKDDYGNVCILGNDYPSYYLNQRNAKLEIKSGMNKIYLSELLRFPQIKKNLTCLSRGIRQANISNRDILNLVVPIPNIKVQNEFADFVAQVDKLKFMKLKGVCS